MMVLSMFDRFSAATHWLLASGIFILTLTALLLVKALAARQLDRLRTLHDFGFLVYLRELVRSTRISSLIALAVLAGLTQLALPERSEKWLQYGFVIIFVLQAALWGNRALSVWLERDFQHHRASNPSGVTHLLVVGLILRILLWVVALLMVLDNLGFNITTLVASLGIGGVAVALAVQNILGDLFSSVSIALDKPFVIGDFIVVGNFMGTVEYVGLKTTRLRSLGGEQIIISNSELLKERIRNYKRMEERRVAFQFGVAYETSVEDVERLPGLVREIVLASSDIVRFDRAHFIAYGESALQFEVVYFMLTDDFNKYMDVQQAINLGILRELRRRGIVFARPTRVVHVAERAGLGEAYGDAANIAPRRAGPAHAVSSMPSPGHRQ
ncbi:mechanosensitive ion channel family protein [Noviherbaspirillum aerium]|uniref:mechanosensitive ion channel family protein n=1 Tax=Noviherbaspirillum aerium TaxID=2588497 RepID=UPI00124D692E|nr:mechanosensitive ion channel family protein [Noviherbaspirillum aerium]